MKRYFKNKKLKDMSPEELKKYRHQYYLDNREKWIRMKDYHLEYQREHRSEITNKYRDYHRARQKEDPDYYNAATVRFRLKQRKQRKGKTTRKKR